MCPKTALVVCLSLFFSWGLNAADYVQVVTHSPGAAGSLWESDLEIQADGGTPAQVNVDLLGRNRDNTTPLATTTVNVAAGDSLALIDLIDDTFGLTSTTGALRMTTTAGSPSFRSRTRNVGLWTYAYDEPVSSPTDVISTGLFGRVIHLTGTVDQRSNLGYVNVTGSTITVDVSLYRADGAFYGGFSVVLAPYDEQATYNIFPSQDVPDGYAVLSTATAGGAFLAHGMVVDNNSGEWIMIPAAAEGSLPFKGFGPDVYYIPLVQRSVDGQTTTARSEFEISTGPNEGVTAQFDFLASNQDNSSPAWAALNVPLNTASRFSDILASWFGTTGTGAVRMTVTSGWLLSADTIAYDETTGSTWGRHIGLTPSTDAFGGSGLSAKVLELQRDADTHSDLGVVNLEPTSSTIAITPIDGGGNALGHSQATLLPFEHREFSSVFAAYGSIVDGSLLVTSNGRFLAYGSVVEESSGDAGYQFASHTPLRFLDGFEDGTTDGWSAVTP